MSSAPSSSSQSSADAKSSSGSGYLFDLDQVDYTRTVATREQLFKMIPHRHEMALLDRVVWASESSYQGVASLKVRGDEFWVRGHFPGTPMMPGVLMVEAGAQLSCYLYNCLQDTPKLCAFLRIDNAVFRQSVTVGQELLVLCNVVKASDRRFVTEIQGVADGQVCFEAKISGMRIADFDQDS